MFTALIELLGGMFGARRAQKRIRGIAERSPGPWRTRATSYREVMVPAPLRESEQRCRRVLASLGQERDVAEVGAIEAVTPPTWRSTGTVIRVQLIATDHGTRVDIAAWPGAQLFDWGASRRAVRDVVKGLGDTIPSGAAAYRR